jgi:predicted nucleotidyltransferase
MSKNIDIDTNVVSDDWITIPFTHKIKEKKEKKEHNILSLEYIIKKTNEIIKKYDPLHAYIYGSYARKTNRVDSDVDILLVYKSNNIQSSNTLEEIKQEIHDEFKLHVDLIVVYISSKSKNKHSELDLCFYDNISIESINMTDNVKFSDIVNDINIKIKV